MITAAVALAFVVFQAAPTPTPGEGAPADECVVKGRPKMWPELTVEVDGTKPFQVYVDLLPVAVTATPGAERAEVAVEGPIAFTAATPIGKVPYLAPGLKVAQGQLVLGRDTALTASGVDARGVIVALGDLDISVPSFIAPCDKLRLGRGERIYDRPEIVSVPKPVRRIPVGDVLELRMKPDAAEVLRVALARGSALTLRETAKKPGWTQVAAAWTDGTRLGGWVPDASIQPLEVEFGLLGDMARGMCGYGVSDAYHGPATLRRGATIHADAEGSVWARATKDVKVIVIGDSGWVEVTEIPGMGTTPGCSRLDFAMVQAKDLVFPRH